MARILIVDDDAGVRRLLTSVLQHLPYEIIEACDGEQATHYLQHQTADLLITDLLMPHKEGLELIQEVKTRHPAIRVIALSGGGMVDPTQYLAFANAFGADSVFTKPIKVSQFLTTIQHLLPHHTATQH